MSYILPNGRIPASKAEACNRVENEVYIAGQDLPMAEGVWVLEGSDGVFD